MKFLKKLIFLSICFNVRNELTLRPKFYEVRKNSYKAIYSEVNKKLFNITETLLNYFEYAIKIFFQYLAHQTYHCPK